ncbi:uncharacterized protein LOC131002985 [Salvia miltiorrhiza]|uniref:uncharacterized protein LOC131002985 n=1 Tax=Salvia miltiorrhiza TaxID=226208 RepID=UPI0025AC87DB|nr:uncharacterized protein LOC131002985 [Salvia miltiorrhiza]
MADMQQNFAQMNVNKNNGELPPQIVVPNNKAQVNVVNLRSGKTLPEVVHIPEEESEPTDVEEKVDEEIEMVKPPASELKEKDDMPKAEEKSKHYALCPKCAKFLKEIRTKKVMYTDDAKFHVGEQVSAVLKRDMSTKCKDPGMFCIPCIIGDTRIEQAMQDLGASINVMPLTIYQELKIGPVKPTRVVIQLTDRSSVYPEGIVEDVLVKVQDLIFLDDFYVLNMGGSKAKPAVMLLGRPFFKMAQTQIDNAIGKLTCQFDGETVTFNLFKATKHPTDIESVEFVDVMDRVVDHAVPSMHRNEEYDLENEMELMEAMIGDFEQRKAEHMQPQVHQTFEVTSSGEEDRLLPSLVRVPKLELKSLPNHLKYIYLGENQTFPVIISSKLSPEQKGRV